MNYTPTGIYSAVEAVNNQPKGRVIAQAPGDSFTGIPENVAAAWVPGKVLICWNQTDGKPVRKLSEETKRRMRDNRIAKRYPLFADQFAGT
jgi:hypothetical protein